MVFVVLISVNGAVRHQQPSPLALPYRIGNILQQKLAGELSVIDLTGPLEEIPGDLYRVFNDMKQVIVHAVKTSQM
jgi:hypothetical protein